MYEELSAKRMRPRPTLTTAEEVIKKDYPLKLPSRVSIQLWNTPEISQFRGYQETTDEFEDRKHTIRVEQEAIGQAARSAGEQNVDMHIAHEMLNQQRQAASAAAQHAENLAALNRQQMAGMQAEQRAELERLSNAHMEAQNRQRIAEGALAGLRDAALEHRNMLAELAARQGHVTNNIDQRQTTTHIDQRQMLDLNVHNQAMNLMHTHAAQFGAYMQQQKLNQEQMMQLLYEHLRRNQPPPAQHYPVIIHYQPPGGGGPPGAPLAIAASSSTPPPPPGGGGAIVAEPARALPAPTPEAVPMIPSAVPHFNIGTPPGSLEPAPRKPIRGKQPQPVTPYAKQRSRSRVAWKGGMVDPPSLPTAPLLPTPDTSGGASSSSAPGAARTDRDQGPIPKGPPPLPPPAEDPPPLTRGRSPAPRRARSTSGSQPRATRQKRTESVDTVLYPAEPRSRSVSIGGTSTIRYPSEGPMMILPTIEDAYEQAAARRTRVLTRVQNKTLKVKAGDALRPALRTKKAAAAEEPSAAASSSDAPQPPQPPPVPRPKARGKAKAKAAASAPRIRKVLITAIPTPKRGRGRPAGSLGKKKRDALMEEELRRMSSVA